MASFGERFANSAASYAEAGNPQVTTGQSQSGIGYTDGGVAYLLNNADSRVNAINQQTLWNREDLKTQMAEAREDTSLDRLVEAGKRNGINPIFLLDALSGNTGTAASYTTSAAKTSNYEVSARTTQANSAKVIGAVIAALAMIAAAAI